MVWLCFQADFCMWLSLPQKCCSLQNNHLATFYKVRSKSLIRSVWWRTLRESFRRQWDMLGNCDDMTDVLATNLISRFCSLPEGESKQWKTFLDLKPSFNSSRKLCTFTLHTNGLLKTSKKKLREIENFSRLNKKLIWWIQRETF